MEWHGEENVADWTVAGLNERNSNPELMFDLRFDTAWRGKHSGSSKSPRKEPVEPNIIEITFKHRILVEYVTLTSACPSVWDSAQYQNLCLFLDEVEVFCTADDYAAPDCFGIKLAPEEEVEATKIEIKFNPQRTAWVTNLVVTYEEGRLYITGPYSLCFQKCPRNYPKILET